MAGNQITVKYHGQDEPVVMPNGWGLLGVGSPSSVPPLEDVPAALDEALSNPVGAPHFESLCKSARRVAILVDDQARATPAASILPRLLDRLSDAGIGAKGCTILFAKGTHRFPTDAEVQRKVGDAAARCRVIVHNPDDEAGLVEVGTTARGTPVWINRYAAEADLSIGIGTVVAHYMVGYGGGPKIMLPGVSGRKSIVANHVWGARPDARQGHIEGNNMYQDMLDAAIIAGLKIKIDFVLDLENRPLRIVAGGPREGHKAAIDAYNAVYGFRLPEGKKADVTIASGYPLELELLQSCKAVLSADLVTRDGGAIVLTSACSTGIGPGFYEGLVRHATSAQVWDWVRTGETTPTGGPLVARLADLFLKKRVVLVTDNIDAVKVRDMGFEYAPSLSAALLELSADYPRAETVIFAAGASACPL